MNITREIDIAIGNHALLMQPTDYSLIVNNVYVVMFPRINCRLLANEKTDGDYNVQLSLLLSSGCI